MTWITATNAMWPARRAVRERTLRTSTRWRRSGITERGATTASPETAGRTPANKPTMITRTILFALLVCSPALACDAEPEPTPSAAATKPTEVAPAKTAAAPAKTEAAPAKVDAPAPTAKPEAAPAKPLATFPALPADAIAIDVLGARMQVPKGTKPGKNINGWQELAAKGGFAMVVRESYDGGMAKAKEELGAVELVVDEPTTLLYRKAGAKDGGFGFVQLVDVKGPEELEGEGDRSYECRAGDAMAWAMKSEPRLGTREQAELMITACRTLAFAPS